MKLLSLISCLFLTSCVTGQLCYTDKQGNRICVAAGGGKAVVTAEVVK